MRKLMRFLSAMAILLSHQAIATPLGFTYEHIWTNTTTANDPEGGSEIVAYDKTSEQVFITNSSEDTLDVLDARTGTKLGSIALGGGPNSVAVKNGIVAVAIEASNKTDPGTVKIFNASDALSSPVLNSIHVGSLPDMLSFTADGKKIIVANEGEAKNGVNPNGSVSIIDISSGISSATIEHSEFSAYNGQEAALRAQGVRLFPGINASQDLEPEYIALSKDGTKAYVTLQENNSLAIIDLNNPNNTPDIVSFGTKDHGLSGQGLDASDKDSIKQVNTFAKLSGMYMPDTIASYNVNGKDYLVTANEGDARDEDKRVSKLNLDPTAFPNAAALQEKESLGRLQVSSIDGDIDNDGDFDQLFSYGTRSFSIWDDVGNLVWDSGDFIEQLLIDQFPGLWAVGREDNKGPEPEGVALLNIVDHWIAFVGLERSSAILAFDITDPNSPFYIDLIANAGDISPEGMLTVTSEDSLDGESYLLVANEVSGTTSLYRVSIPEPGSIILLLFGLLLLHHRLKSRVHFK